MHGTLGTGKTGLLQAIVVHLAYRICLLTLQGLSNDNLTQLLRSISPTSIVGIENIDPHFRGRKSLIHVNGFNILTFTGLISAQDGIYTCD